MKDEIIRMAREAGFGPSVAWKECTPPFERFATLVAAAEREACAKVAEKTVCDTHLPTGLKIHGTRAAAAIRARSNT